MPFRRRSPLVVALAVALISGPLAVVADAAIVGTEGEVQACQPPASLAQGGAESDTNVSMFAERQNVTVGAPISVDATGPRIAFGSAVQYDDPSQLGGGTVPSGTVVDSFYFHTDPVGQPAGGVTFSGTATFSAPILGVIVSANKLAASDGQLALPGQTTEQVNRGYELGPQEWFSLSTDNRTLQFQVHTYLHVDDIRVITQHDTAPEGGTNTACGNGKALAGTGTGGSGTPTIASPGYRLVTAKGGVFAYGSDALKGSVVRTNNPILGGTSTPTRDGYWLVASDGGIFTFGDAPFYGSTGAVHLNQPVVGMPRTPSGKGYWLVARDGGIFSFGDARFFGSTGAIHLNQPIIGMSATPSGNGYWLVASDGGIFSFGDAAFLGSTGAIHLNKPIVGMSSTPTGNGYWLAASDGGIFTFGDAGYFGSTGGIRLNRPVVGMLSPASGNGYWLASSDGGIFTFGGAPFLGSAGNVALASPVVAVIP